MKTDHSIENTGNLELLARQLVEGFITGLHKSPYHGFSVEFAEHRLYNEGDSTRHIDWKVYARTNKLFTKQYEEETNLRCMLALDISGSMYYPAELKSKIKFVQFAAAALGYLMNRQRDAVGLCLFDSAIRELTPVKSSPTHLAKILTRLAALPALKPAENGSTSVAEVLHELAEKIHRRSLVILFSDMFDGNENPADIFKALQHLKHNKHEVIVFHVSDHKTELNFDFQDRPTEFIDLETGAKLRLNPGDLRSTYTSRVQSYHNELKIKCHQYKIDFVEVDVSNSFDLILQTFLVRRAKMR